MASNVFAVLFHRRQMFDLSGSKPLPWLDPENMQGTVKKITRLPGTLQMALGIDPRL